MFIWSPYTDMKMHFSLHHLGHLVLLYCNHLDIGRRWSNFTHVQVCPLCVCACVLLPKQTNLSELSPLTHH